MATTTVLVTAVAPSEADRIAQHLGRVSDVVESHGGRVTERSVDGVIAAFTSATEAVRAAVALQQACERDARLLGGLDGLRIGIHVGDIVAEVEAAAREICAAAAPRDAIASDLVRQLVGSRAGIDFRATPDSSRWQVGWVPLITRPSISVVVAEDSVLVRIGIVSLLREEGFDVLADVGDHDALLAAARQHRPMLVVTDVRMPPAQSDEGIAAAATLRTEDPSVGVLVLSQHVEPSAAALLLTNNPTAVGYLLKERVSDLDEFVEACRVVAAGGVVIDPLITEQLLARRTDNATDRLSEREREVLGLMAQGRSNAAIARQASCSAKTLETHIRSIFTKLDLLEDPDDHRRVAAVVRYLHANQTR